MTPEEIDSWVKLREGMREAKHYAEADSIRRELERKGIIVEDRRNGTSRWRFK